MPRPTVAQPVENPPPQEGPVIDVEYKVVGRASRALRYAAALLGAALTGALLPAAWALAELLGR